MVLRFPGCFRWIFRACRSHLRQGTTTTTTTTTKNSINQTRHPPQPIVLRTRRSPCTELVVPFFRSARSCRDIDRSHLAAEQAAREEERLHQECTFRPDLPTERAAAAAAAAAGVLVDYRQAAVVAPRVFPSLRLRQLRCQLSFSTGCFFSAPCASRTCAFCGVLDNSALYFYFPRSNKRD